VADALVRVKTCSVRVFFDMKFGSAGPLNGVSERSVRNSLDEFHCVCSAVLVSEEATVASVCGVGVWTHGKSAHSRPARSTLLITSCAQRWLAIGGLVVCEEGV
jgi:hypothetical protein